MSGQRALLRGARRFAQSTFAREPLCCSAAEAGTGCSASAPLQGGQTECSEARSLHTTRSPSSLTGLPGTNAATREASGSFADNARRISTTSRQQPGCSLGAAQLLARGHGPALGMPARLQLVRHLNVHEYQGASLMSKHGVNVPRGEVASTPEQAEAAAQQLSQFSKDGQVVIKSQVLAGGRGLGTFKNGFKGGVHIAPASEIKGIAEKMLGQILVTKQTGPEGKPVNKVLVAEKVSIVNEMYFAILLDRATAGPMMIACSKGGTSIEDLAESHPDLIIKVPVRVSEGLTDVQVQQVLAGLAPKVCDSQEAAQQIRNLLALFNSCDCTMLEINPLVETEDKRLIAADAKLNFDDNAAFRQKEIFAMRDHSQEDPREVAAAAADLNYIGLSGEIGCMVNGAGLAMATMDIIQLRGSSPANFLDVGGAAEESQVVEAFKILTGDPKVKAILVNIFGGIMKCDVIAAGIVNAAKQVELKVPLVVRLEGTNVDLGRKILSESGMTIISAEDLDDAAVKAVQAVRG